MRRITAVVAASALVLGLSAVPAQAAVPMASGMRWDLDGTATPLAPPPGSTRAYPLALSDSNVAAGYAWVPSGDTEVEHAVRWDAAGVITDLGVVPGDFEAQAQDVNAGGVVVGNSFSDGFAELHAARWAADGTLTRLPGLPDTTAAEAWAIADNGTVVGDSGSDEIHAVPVRWSRDGTITALAMPAGGSYGSARQIADDGWIAGYVYEGNAIHVVRWSPSGAVTDLGAPATVDNQPTTIAPDGAVTGNSTGYYDGTSTPSDTWGQLWNRAGTRTVLERSDGFSRGYALGMNDKHVVVGRLTSSTDGAAARWSADGKLTVLERTSEYYTEAVGINDAGVIAGTSHRQAARWSKDGVLTLLGVPPGSAAATGVAVNARGSVLGSGSES